MRFGPLEIIAIIVIAFSVIKLTVIVISPAAWINFARKVYVKPPITSAVAVAPRGREILISGLERGEHPTDVATSMGVSARNPP